MRTSSANLAAAVKFLSNLLARSRTDSRLCCSVNWAVSCSTTSFNDKPLLSSFGSSTIWLSGPNLYFGKQLEAKLTSAETSRTDTVGIFSSISGLIFVIVSDQILWSSQLNTKDNISTGPPKNHIIKAEVSRETKDWNLRMHQNFTQ